METLTMVVLLAMTLRATAFEKVPGATNAAVTAGDKAEFRCTPLDKHVHVNEKGEVWRIDGGKPRKLAPGFLSEGWYAGYLECFLVGNDVVAAHKNSNGGDGGIDVDRVSMKDGRKLWHISVLGLNLAPPKLKGSTLTVNVDGASIDIDVEKGKVIGTDSKGCVNVSRWPKDGEVHSSVGSGCPKGIKPGTIVVPKK